MSNVVANTIKFTRNQCIIDLIQIIKNTNPHTHTHARAHARENFTFVYIFLNTVNYIIQFTMIIIFVHTRATLYMFAIKKKLLRQT